MKHKFKILFFAAFVFFGVAGILSFKIARGQDVEQAVVPTMETGAGMNQTAITRGREIVKILSRLKSVKLDLAFFNRPIFKTLVSNTVQLPKLEVGRANPFAPFEAKAPVVSQSPSM